MKHSDGSVDIFNIWLYLHLSNNHKFIFFNSTKVSFVDQKNFAILDTFINFWPLYLLSLTGYGAVFSVFFEVASGEKHTF